MWKFVDTFLSNFWRFQILWAVTLMTSLILSKKVYILCILLKVIMSSKNIWAPIYFFAYLFFFFEQFVRLNWCNYSLNCALVLSPISYQTLTKLNRIGRRVKKYFYLTFRNSPNFDYISQRTGPSDRVLGDIVNDQRWSTARQLIQIQYCQWFADFPIPNQSSES